MNETVEFVELELDGRSLSIDYQWLGGESADAPLLVFLHEGLGSLAMWKDFPAALCAAGGYRGLVFSRPGYGRSTSRLADERWSVDFMHVQARELLPRLLQALEIDEKPWLFGHSDGGSIALIYATEFPEAVAGLVVMAPHIMVEDISVESIAQARRVYLETDLKQRLARYHDDPDSAFWGWNDVWLDPAFRRWSIEDELDQIRCPILAIQGRDDEYGTLAQIRGIAARAEACEIAELDDCGHSPQRDRRERVIELTLDFIARQGVSTPTLALL